MAISALLSTGGAGPALSIKVALVASQRPIVSLPTTIVTIVIIVMMVIILIILTRSSEMNKHRG